MALTLISAPAAQVLALDELQEHLRLYPCGSPPETPDDALIQRLAEAAVSELDGADGWLGRALIEQSWYLTLPQFPPCDGPIWLPLTSPQWGGASPAPAPVGSLEYVASDGTVTALVDGVDFEVVTNHDPQYIRPVYGRHWPCARCQSDAVRVQYTAGYGAAGTDVPAVIRAYLLLRVGQLYEYRELVGAAAAVAPVPYMRDMLESVRQRRRLCERDD